MYTIKKWTIRMANHQPFVAKRLSFLLTSYPFFLVIHFFLLKKSGRNCKWVGDASNQVLQLHSCTDCVNHHKGSTQVDEVRPLSMVLVLGQMFAELWLYEPALWKQTGMCWESIRVASWEAVLVFSHCCIGK